jgi:hypothetical protein
MNVYRFPKHIALALGTVALTLSQQTIAWAKEFKPLVSCNNRELVIDREIGNDSKSTGRLQIVVNGKLPIDTLLYPVEGLNETLKKLDVSFHNEGNTMVVSNLVGGKRIGDFVHIYEGAGYYPFQISTSIDSIFDLEYVGDAKITQIPAYVNPIPTVSVDFFKPVSPGASTGIGGSAPARNDGTLNLSFGNRNEYNFFGCVPEPR